LKGTFHAGAAIARPAAGDDDASRDVVTAIAGNLFAIYFNGMHG